MPSFVEHQGTFARALLHADQPAPSELCTPVRASAQRRFNVYRNNVIVGLISTLKDAYPVVARLVGDAFFDALAHAYILQHPPKSPLMFDYGAHWADFIADFAPARPVPYLPDIARLERAWGEAYHAGEATSLSLQTLANLDPAHIPQLKLALHSSLRLVRATFSVLEIWRRHVDNAPLDALELVLEPQDILIVRPASEVEVRSLPIGYHEFLSAVSMGASIAEATQCTLDVCTTFDPGVTLLALSAAHAFVLPEALALSPPQPTHGAP